MYYQKQLNVQTGSSTVSASAKRFMPLLEQQDCFLFHATLGQENSKDTRKLCISRCKVLQGDCTWPSVFCDTAHEQTRSKEVRSSNKRGNSSYWCDWRDLLCLGTHSKDMWKPYSTCCNRCNSRIRCWTTACVFQLDAEKVEVVGTLAGTLESTLVGG